MADASIFSVQKVARLARIEIPEHGWETIEQELGSILKFVDKINEVELSDIQPFFGNAEQSAAPMRDDRVTASLDRQDALKNAPDADGEYYLVPPVFGKTD